MQTVANSVWEDAIRRYDRRVYLSVLALGLSPDRAREIVQMTWTRLIEQYAEGALQTLELPGLAIRQARFLALNEHRRTRAELRVLATVEAPAQPDVDRVLESREQIARVLDALDACSPTAKKIFRLVYATPNGSCAAAAQQVGLSLQRVRQILCETRSHIRRAMQQEVTP
jgi:RNA polymerase sigma factor (sigma-70 family)